MLVCRTLKSIDSSVGPTSTAPRMKADGVGMPIPRMIASTAEMTNARKALSPAIK